MPGTRKFCFLLIGLIPAVLGLYAGARAAEERVVELPLSFSLEGPDVKTTACFRVREKIYGADRAPWSRFRNQARTSPEIALTKTIAALRNKDIARLKELSHSRLGRDPKWYQEQAPSQFAIFERMKLGDVWGYYGVGDLVAFFVEVKLSKGSFFSGFSFAREETGNFGYLPYGSRSLPRQFVSQWFHSAWGPVKSQSPAYCTPSQLERMTHRVVLEDPSRSTKSATELLFIGRPLTDGKAEGEPYAALRAKISALMNALRSGRMDEYFAGFTDRGKKKIKDWFLSAQEAERRKYIKSVLRQDPFFVINADPIFVVYSRVAPSGIQALYFLRDKIGRFRWANAAYATNIDTLFKSERFKEAAREEKPFDSRKINRSTPRN